MAASIVIVEDEAIIALSLQDMLEMFGYTVPAIAATAAEALAAVARHQPDLLLLDIHLAGAGDGIAVAEQVRASSDLPIIFLTAHADSATVARARAAQPYHYLLKPFNEHEIRIAIELALAKSRADRELRASEQLFSTTLRSIADGVIVTDTACRITYLNPAAAQITGWPAGEALGREIEEVFQIISEAGESISSLTIRAIRERQSQSLPPDAVLLRRDGVRRYVADSLSPLLDERGQARGAVLVFRDASEERKLDEERKLMERRRQESQQLEALGVLAGGIAHDFNNLLASILGYAELALADTEPGSERARYLSQVVQGGRRAAELTNMMLAYAGKGRVESVPLDLSQLVATRADLFQSSLGRQVSLVRRLAPSLPPVMADKTQIQQIILNLLANAAEALPAAGGQITLTSGAVALGAEDLRGCVLGNDQPPGRYVFLQVEDTGVGMDAETMGRIFEPFFTTKFTGRGLGLSALQGIVRGHQGALRVVSSPGRGSSFTIYLPAASAAEEAPQPQATGERRDPRAAGGRGTLLVIDDEEAVRKMMTRMLEHLGYKAVTAGSGPTGLSLLAAGVDGLRGVLLDLSMPGMGGAAVAPQIHALAPEVPIIVMSGYNADEIALQHRDLPIRHILQKPFTRDSLLAALAVLDG